MNAEKWYISRFNPCRVIDAGAAIVCTTDGPGDISDQIARAAQIVREHNERAGLIDACDEALNALIGCAVPGPGCDDKRHILEAQQTLRKVLAEAEGESVCTD